MKWIHSYDLFLFDFDGLLVNTEELHFQAYLKMCSRRGFHLPWDFRRFALAAHYSSNGLQEQIYAALPNLKDLEPDWKVLYAEKKAAYIDLIKEGAVKLMPGVEKLLLELSKSGISRCVVSHSSLDSIGLIRSKLSVLNTIPYWVTRENYTQPKPHPECYAYAINKYSNGSQRVIGFEDVPKGLNALLKTIAKPVLICADDAEFLASLPGIRHFPSFESISDINAP